MKNGIASNPCISILKISQTIPCTSCLEFDLTATEDMTVDLIFIALNTGCEVYESFDILIQPKEEEPEIEIYIPNIFTPNDDGNNDAWGVEL